MNHEKSTTQVGDHDDGVEVTDNRLELVRALARLAARRDLDRASMATPSPRGRKSVSSGY